MPRNYSQGLYLQNVIFIVLKKGLSDLISWEDFSKIVFLKRPAGKLASDQLPQLVSKLTQYLTPAMRKILYEDPNFFRMLDSFVSNKSFLNLLACLNECIPGMCAGHAVIDMVKKLEEESLDDVFHVLDFHPGEPITNALIRDVQTSFTSLLTAFELQTNLITLEEKTR